MDTMEINIALDPINDGAVMKETRLKRKDEGALIVATNGESRIVDAYEAQDILDKLNEIGHGEYMGNSDYIAMMNGDKIINFGTGKCFVGSAIVMKFDGRTLSMLVGDEFEKAAAEFRSRLITLVCEGQEFSAYELI